MAGAALALVAWLVMMRPEPGAAEHRVYFRYVVLGYVTDDAGRPLRARTVRVLRDKTGIGYDAETDGDGLFVAVMRLGDESAGETLTVLAGKARAAIVARFDPSDRRADRGTRVDLEGTRFVERPAAFQATLARVLGSAVR